MSFSFQHVSSLRKLLWASLAINLFLVGAVVGAITSGFSPAMGFMRPPGPDSRGEPPQIRMLYDLRSRLSGDGKQVFDAEFSELIAQIRDRTNPRFIKETLQATLRDPSATEDDIRDAFENLKRIIVQDLTEMLDHSANVAVRLSEEDRIQMALVRPGGMPRPAVQ